MSDVREIALRAPEYPDWVTYGQADMSARVVDPAGREVRVPVEAADTLHEIIAKAKAALGPTP